MKREPPPPGLIAAAEQNYQAIQNDLATLITDARALLASNRTEVEVVTDVWLTLLHHGPPMGATLGATAIIRLAAANHAGEHDHRPWAGDAPSPTIAMHSGSGPAQTARPPLSRWRQL